MKYTSPLNNENYSITDKIEILSTGGTGIRRLESVIMDESTIRKYVPQKYANICEDEFNESINHYISSALVYIGGFPAKSKNISTTKMAEVFNAVLALRRNLIIVPESPAPKMEEMFSGRMGLTNPHSQTGSGYYGSKVILDEFRTVKIDYPREINLVTDVSVYYGVNGALTMCVVGHTPTLGGILNLEYMFKAVDVLVSVHPPTEAVDLMGEGVLDCTKESGIVSEIRKMVSPKVHVFLAEAPSIYQDDDGNYLVAISKKSTDGPIFSLDRRLKQGIPIKEIYGYPDIETITPKELDLNGIYQDSAILWEVRHPDQLGPCGNLEAGFR